MLFQLLRELSPIRSYIEAEVDQEYLLRLDQWKEVNLRYIFILHCRREIDIFDGHSTFTFPTLHSHAADISLFVNGLVYNTNYDKLLLSLSNHP